MTADLVAGASPCSAPTATCFASTSIAGWGRGQHSKRPGGADKHHQRTAIDSRSGVLGPALATSSAGGLGSLYLKIPKPGTENDDHNPQRIQPRSLFDIAVGHDNIFHGDRYKFSARLEVINLTDKEALYNFLSTFSGTHYVTPRTVTGAIGFLF